MEKIVYILGAGFSRPLGLPLMNDFIEKSKDMYFDNIDNSDYSDFQSIFNTIRDMAISKQYYDTDLDNIEEVLSILEMQKFTGERTKVKSFLEYICKVIKYYTPEINWDVNDFKSPPEHWRFGIWGKEEIWNDYGYFVMSMIGNKKMVRKYHREDNIHYWKIEDVRKNTHYSVVTMNYDLVLESICESFNKNFRYQDRNDKVIYFNREYNKEDPVNSNNTYLAKLHGCVSTGIVIPPTWNKGLVDKEILPEWKLAYNLLKNATQIRIIGYSMPITDSYIKYLLRAAIIKSDHFKKIDVIILDDNGDAHKRYSDFIKAKNFRFKSRDVKDYLYFIKKNTGSFVNLERDEELIFNRLEDTHETFMKT
ncbi:MAG: SIR2 family protein [Chlorobi bacterium]|nr:SIR2 family protein [Chlorobiota bacterium]MCI0717023.1 SIR2 family protein [Chlorobiota bacterium]